MTLSEIVGVWPWLALVAVVAYLAIGMAVARRDCDDPVDAAGVAAIWPAFFFFDAAVWALTAFGRLILYRRRGR